jgi:hypothetical protein
MQAGGGKQKGSAFERTVCERLSLWVTDGERKDCFWRSAMSGGRATRGRKRGEDLSRQAGDITAVSPEGNSLVEHFYIECKAYRELHIERFVLNGSGTLSNFWKTTIEEARNHGRRPMLIAKQNRMPVIILTKSDDLREFLGPTLYHSMPGAVVLCSLHNPNGKYNKLGWELDLLDSVLQSSYMRRRK